MYSRIQAALLPVIAQEIRTHAGFQKIPEKEIATCAPVSTEGEVKAGEDTAELRFQFIFFFWRKNKMFLQNFHVTWGGCAFTEGLEWHQAGESSVFNNIDHELGSL